MGQLERYGLYVLVVVIFLILGVAIMGSDPAAPRENLAVVDPGVRGAANDPGETPSAKFPTFFGGRVAYTPVEQPRPSVPSNGGAGGPDDSRFRAVASQPNESVDNTGTPPSPVVNPSVQPRNDPRPTPTPEPTGRTHRVARGDTFSSLAETFYGSQGKWKVIADANPNVNPNKMKEGTVLAIPEIPAEASAPRTAPAQPVDAPARTARSSEPVDAVAADGSRNHVVAANEFMGRIAKRYYGDANLWKRIADANPTVDPNRMPEGTILRIPPKN